jgi:hypothetical protein
MIVDDFDVECVVINPPEADTPLVVDANRMLSSAVGEKRFEPVAGRIAEIVEDCGAVDLAKFAPGAREDVGGNASRRVAVRDVFSGPIGIAAYHLLPPSDRQCTQI